MACGQVQIGKCNKYRIKQIKNKRYLIVNLVKECSKTSSTSPMAENQKAEAKKNG
jgi:hypothetical protein